jgi:hypothetical protein
MQATFQNQQHKHIFFSGPKGIKTELEDNAMLKIKNEKFLFSEEKDDYIGQLILDQNRLTEWNFNQEPDKQRNVSKIINNNRADAISYILKHHSANENQIRALDISETDLLFEQAFLDELVNYLISQLNENRVFKIGCVWTAKGGHLVNYSILNRISDDLEYYYRKEKELSVPKLKKNAPREMYNMAGEVIEYGLEESPEEKRLKAMKSGNINLSDETLTLYDCIDKIRELRNQYRAEIYKTSAEKSIPMNLCYFLLYDPMPIKDCRTKDEAFRYRISKLRKSNLLILLQLFCNIHNQTYKTEIDNAQKIMNNMKRSIKEYSAEEKRFLVQAGKSYPLKQKEVIAQTGFGRTIVQKYWQS